MNDPLVICPAGLIEISDAKGEVFLYAVAPAPSGLDTWACLLERQDTEAVYRVAVDCAEVWRCSCADFRYRHHPSPEDGCKHVEEARKVKQLLDRFAPGIASENQRTPQDRGDHDD